MGQQTRGSQIHEHQESGRNIPPNTPVCDARQPDKPRHRRHGTDTAQTTRRDQYSVIGIGELRQATHKIAQPVVPRLRTELHSVSRLAVRQRTVVHRRVSGGHAEHRRHACDMGLHPVV